MTAAKTIKHCKSTWLYAHTKKIFTEAHTEPIEFLLALMGMAWGLWFFSYSNAFESSPIYRVFTSICNYEWAWGLLYGFSGVIRLLSLLCGSVRVRKAMAFWCTIMWLFTAVSIHLVNPASTGAPTTFCLAIASAWSYWRLPCCR